MHFPCRFSKAWFWILALVGNCEIAVLYVNNNVFYGFSKFMFFCNRTEKHDFRNPFRVENQTKNNGFLLRILKRKSLKISWKLRKSAAKMVWKTEAASRWTFSQFRGAFWLDFSWCWAPKVVENRYGKIAKKLSGKRRLLFHTSGA